MLTAALQYAMAPTASSGQDLENLSSNWKILQARLKADTSRPPKRKRREDESAIQPLQNNGTNRHRRLEGQRAKKLNQSSAEAKGSSRMGSGWSTTKAEAEAPSASLALWAEDNDIPAKDLAAAYGPSLKSTSVPSLQDTVEVTNAGLSRTVEAGKYVAVDCEMVGVGPTPDTDSALARVSIVNYHGQQVYDSFVLPKEAVTDYRTFVSGITPQLLQQARTLEEVQKDVAALLDGKILIGHAVRNDLDALMLGHPRRDVRDTSRHPAFRSLAAGRTPSLKKLAREVLGVDIQGGEHSSVEDARATMLLFRREKAGFEREHIARWGPERKDHGTRQDDDAKKTNRKRKKKSGK